MLYIVLFLHQTTTIIPILDYEDSCISYYSYIKPQLLWPPAVERLCCISYYSYIKPQLQLSTYIYPQVVYRTIPTSNHNSGNLIAVTLVVVYRTIPTSNHNSVNTCVAVRALYIVLFLHQTTTTSLLQPRDRRCISYYSYIKPQQQSLRYRRLPGCISYYSYIKPQLSQVSCLSA